MLSFSLVQTPIIILFRHQDLSYEEGYVQASTAVNKPNPMHETFSRYGKALLSIPPIPESSSRARSSCTHPQPCERIGCTELPKWQAETLCRETQPTYSEYSKPKKSTSCKNNSYMNIIHHLDKIHSHSQMCNLKKVFDPRVVGLVINHESNLKRDKIMSAVPCPFLTSSKRHEGYPKSESDLSTT